MVWPPLRDVRSVRHSGGVNGRNVDAALRPLARPVLREHGFDAFTARSAWRHSDHSAAVVTFQSFTRYEADKIGCTSFSFALVGGVSYRCLPSFRERPKDYQCPFRCSARRSLSQPWFPHRAVWFVLDDGSNLEETVSDAVRELTSTMLPFIERIMQPREAFLELLSWRPSAPTEATLQIVMPGAGSDTWYSTTSAIGALVSDDPDPLIRSSPALQAALDAAEARGDYRLHRKWTTPVE